MLFSEHIRKKFNQSGLSILVEFLSEVRRKRSELVPFLANSPVAVALIEEAFAAHVKSQQLSVKELFLRSGYSPIGLRYQFDRLVERGFLSTTPSTTDRRRKLVSITEKTLKIYAEVLENSKAQLILARLTEPSSSQSGGEL